MNKENNQPKSLSFATYTGTKTLKAEPMNEYEAEKLGYTRPNDDNHEWREGYHLVYPDGYNSWIPKDVFEASYQRSETFYDRLLIEAYEVANRRGKLSSFIKGTGFEKLSEREQLMLKTQYYAMSSYVGILFSRIEMYK